MKVDGSTGGGGGKGGDKLVLSQLAGNNSAFHTNLHCL